jgi:hypothetical protein
MILTQSEQDRVVDDAAVRSGDEDVLALPHRALVQVARDEHVREPERVRPGDLHLPLDADVPERDRVQELPVLLDRIAVVPRVVHVVVEAVPLHPVTPRRVEIGRLPDPGVQENLGVLVDLHQSGSSPLWCARVGTPCLSAACPSSRRGREGRFERPLRVGVRNPPRSRRASPPPSSGAPEHELRDCDGAGPSRGGVRGPDKRDALATGRGNSVGVRVTELVAKLLQRLRQRPQLAPHTVEGLVHLDTLIVGELVRG